VNALIRLGRTDRARTAGTLPEAVSIILQPGKKGAGHVTGRMVKLISGRGWAANEFRVPDQNRRLLLRYERISEAF